MNETRIVFTRDDSDFRTRNFFKFTAHVFHFIAFFNVGKLYNSGMRGFYAHIQIRMLLYFI